MEHIAFIMDGNGRWSTEQGLPRAKGHEEGAKALVRAIEDMAEMKIPCVSFYAFSTENESREVSEVSNILGVIAYFLGNVIKPLALKLDINIRVIGEISHLPLGLADIISELTASTINNKGMKVVLAICYGGDKEVAYAVNTILKRRMDLADDSEVTPEEIASCLYTAPLANPDIVIRYGGHCRLSNFLPLQTIYSELFFLDKYWPNYNKDDVIAIIDKFNHIKRNFGGTNG